MAESTVDDIIRLIMRQGEIEADRIEKEAQWQQEIKRQKNAWKRNTLKFMATVGPMFIPGLGPLGGIWSKMGIGAATGAAAGGLGWGLSQAGTGAARSAFPSIASAIGSGVGGALSAGGDSFNPMKIETPAQQLERLRRRRTSQFLPELLPQNY